MSSAAYYGEIHLYRAYIRESWKCMTWNFSHLATVVCGYPKKAILKHDSRALTAALS
jgi:hypothetical protein